MQDILSSIIAAEKACGDIMLKHKAHHITDKSSSRDLVTEYDSLVQSMLISKFSAEIPDARFFCEEDNRHDSLSAKHVFIIDPIDGTMNFVRHMNLSCISVAYASYGETLAAAVYNPFTVILETARLRAPARCFYPTKQQTRCSILHTT